MTLNQDQAASLRMLNARPTRAPSFAFIGAEGVGTSTLVTELAVGVAFAGGQPLVIDCCAGQQIARRLGVPTTATLETQVISMSGLAEMTARSRQGVTLVNLYARPEERALFSSQLWLRLGAEFAAQERDATSLLIDVPNPAIDPVPACVADNLILVLTPQAESLTMAYATIKRLATMYGRTCFNVLVNRARHLEEARELFARLSSVASEFLTVALRWVGFVPEDGAIRRSQALHRPSLEAFPQSESSIAFAQLAAVLPQWHTTETTNSSTGYMDMLIAASRDWAESEGAV
ncbi:MinD/ParA family ATP-binding protein [Paludibacterium purpuratum]|uniref:Flagellar biosynthesis protein FlhG n=1 Tax=Paludibacterium purpuratum TaxID=1144873 RepID=A0A4R7BCA6_9NEIS|nr:flagellar synthesis regulator FleN [Paludibacterium purpuratum]TDR82664.1 flagellar biosynthesis protein FlhG [Paludibacterium purpuratum]